MPLPHRVPHIPLPLSLFQQFKSRWINCTECHLSERRQKVVLSRGTYPCQVVLIGEAPGASENVIGRPFCGPAGHLIDYIVSQAIPSNIPYAFTNLVCCIPRGDDGKKIHEPDDEAVKACSPRLQEFIALCDPLLIIAVGKQAEDWLTPGYSSSIKFHKRIPVVKIIHPAAILRMNVSQQGLSAQKAIITVRNAVEDYVLKKEDTDNA